MRRFSKFSDHDVIILLPDDYDEKKKYKLLILNDGDILNKVSLTFDGIILGIIPSNRLDEYTPWKEKAIRDNVPDFGGLSLAYHDLLEKEILPSFLKEYSIDENYLIYGGYSLGGLCAISSLYHNHRFTHVFSVCGSFWFPEFVEYVQNTKVVNLSAKIYLLNGENEGKNHDNLLKDAPSKAKMVHQRLSQSNETISLFDEYGHHEKLNERLNRLIALIR